MKRGSQGADFPPSVCWNSPSSVYLDGRLPTRGEVQQDPVPLIDQFLILTSAGAFYPNLHSHVNPILHLFSTYRIFTPHSH